MVQINNAYKINYCRVNIENNAAEGAYFLPLREELKRTVTIFMKSSSPSGHF